MIDNLEPRTIDNLEPRTTFFVVQVFFLARKEMGEGRRTLGLNYTQLRHSINQPDFVQLPKTLAQGGTIAQVSAGYDDMIRHLPTQLLQQFRCHGFLAFNTEGI